MVLLITVRWAWLALLGSSFAGLLQHTRSCIHEQHCAPKQIACCIIGQKEDAIKSATVLCRECSHLCWIHLWHGKEACHGPLARYDLRADLERASKPELCARCLSLTCSAVMRLTLSSRSMSNPSQQWNSIICGRTTAQRCRASRRAPSLSGNHAMPCIPM